MTGNAKNSHGKSTKLKASQVRQIARKLDTIGRDNPSNRKYVVAEVLRLRDSGCPPILAVDRVVTQMFGPSVLTTWK